MANENKDALDIQGISNQAMRNLMHLNLFFSESDVEGQRLLISRLFPDKLTFDGEKH